MNLINTDFGQFRKSQFLRMRDYLIWNYYFSLLTGIYLTRLFLRYVDLWIYN